MAGWNRELILIGLRLPAPGGFPIAKNGFQLPPAAFRTFSPRFLLLGEESEQDREGERERFRWVRLLNQPHVIAKLQKLAWSGISLASHSPVDRVVQHGVELALELDWRPLEEQRSLCPGLGLF